MLLMAGMMDHMFHVVQFQFVEFGSHRTTNNPPIADLDITRFPSTHPSRSLLNEDGNFDFLICDLSLTLNMCGGLRDASSCRAETIV